MRPIILVLAALLFWQFPPQAKAEDGVITLRVHHFLGPKSTTHTRMIVPWARTPKNCGPGTQAPCAALLRFDLWRDALNNLVSTYSDYTHRHWKCQYGWN